MTDVTRQFLLKALILLGAVAIGGALFWLGGELKLKDAGPEMKLPLLVIAGVVMLLLTLALVAVAYSLLDLSNRDQALALPEGSVRAVIALMLLVIFAIVAIYLYASLSSSGRIRAIEGVPSAQEADLRKQVNVVAVVSSTPAGTIKVYYKDVSGSAEDVAKQLIVLLGTLVTAVASFYFGSSSVASAQAAVTRALSSTGGPNATSVEQSTLKADGSAQQLKVTGTNLGKVKTLKIVSSDGKVTIQANADSVKPSETEVSCTVTVPVGTPIGAWDVVVSDNANNDSTVPKGVTISAKPSEAVPPAKPTASPEISNVDGAALKADGTVRLVKISGKNLTDIETVKVAPDSGITVVKITPGAGDQITVDLKIENATPPERNVSVVNKAGTESKPVKVMFTA